MSFLVKCCSLPNLRGSECFGKVPFGFGLLTPKALLEAQGQIKGKVATQIVPSHSNYSHSGRYCFMADKPENEKGFNIL